MFTGEQLGQGYTNWASVPWAAGGPSGLPQRAVFPDAALQFWPWAEVARDQLRDGHIPLWNPYEYGGTALLGNMQSALFFPLTWPLLVLPLGYAWGVVAIAKLVVAGVGAFALSRMLRVPREGALLAGAVYMLSAPLIAWLQWPLGSAFAVFPWLLLTTARLQRDRGPGAIAALALAAALTILAGHPETALMAVSAAAIYLITVLVLERRPPEALRTGGAWLAAMVLGTAAAGVAVLPFVEAFSPSISRIADSAFGESLHLPLSNSLHYVLPGLFGDGEPVLYEGSYYQSIAAYFGLPALVLAGVALVRLRRNPEALGITAMGGVALMAAYGVPPVSWFVENVPPWADSVVAARANFIPALAGAVGAGAGLGVVMRHPMAVRRVALVLTGTGLTILAAFVLADQSSRLPAPTDVKRDALLAGLGWLAAAGLVLVAAGRLRRSLTLLLALGVAVLSLVQLQGLNVTLPPEQAYPGEPPSVAALTRQPGSFRVGMLRTGAAINALAPNTASLYGLETLEGYDFPLSQRWSDFQTAALGFAGLRAESRKAGSIPPPPRHAAMRMMNVRYYLAAPDDQPPLPGLETIYRGQDATVFRDRGALPRAYVVPQTRPRSYPDALIDLARGELDPRRTALVPQGSPPPGRPASGGFRAARVENPSPDHVRVRLAPGSAGWLVLANAYHPNWKAEVDGREVEVRPTNVAAMGVPVSASARTVDFRLDRGTFWAGAALSAVALAAIALLAGLGLRRRQARRAST